jgi:hypothetical protein
VLTRRGEAVLWRVQWHVWARPGASGRHWARHVPGVAVLVFGQGGYMRAQEGEGHLLDMMT